MVEGNVLFNDALNTFYLRLYGVRHIMVKNHSDSERENPLPPHGGPIELFLVPTSASRLVQQRPWYVLSLFVGWCI